MNNRSDIDKTINLLKTLSEQATDAPWKKSENPFADLTVLAGPDIDTGTFPIPDVEEDVDLIIAMRNHLPDILERLEYLEKELYKTERHRREIKIDRDLQLDSVEELKQEVEDLKAGKSLREWVHEMVQEIDEQERNAPRVARLMSYIEHLETSAKKREKQLSEMRDVLTIQIAESGSDTLQILVDRILDFNNIQKKIHKQK